MKMTKGGAILSLLTEIKLELKEVRESVDRMQVKLDKMEKQMKERKESKSSSLPKNEKDWKYPSKME